MFKSFGRKEGRNVTAQQAPPMPQISPDRYDTFSRDRQPSTGFSSSSLNGNGNAKSNGGNGFLSSVGSKKANAVNGNGNAPVERHGSALYPELAELMTRNERWAKRVATTDPG
jgi:hypothetical protein